MPAQIAIFEDNARFGGADSARQLFRAPPRIGHLIIAVPGTAEITGPCEIRIRASESLKIDVARRPVGGASVADASNSALVFSAGETLPMLLDAGQVWDIDVKAA
jgi:hypothetical protein